MTRAAELCGLCWQRQETHSVKRPGRWWGSRACEPCAVQLVTAYARQGVDAHMTRLWAGRTAPSRTMPG